MRHSRGRRYEPAYVRSSWPSSMSTWCPRPNTSETAIPTLAAPSTTWQRSSDGGGTPQAFSFLLHADERMRRKVYQLTTEMKGEYLSFSAGLRGAMKEHAEIWSECRMEVLRAPVRRAALADLSRQPDKTPATGTPNPPVKGRRAMRMRRPAPRLRRRRRRNEPRRSSPSRSPPPFVQGPARGGPPQRHPPAGGQAEEGP